jgi:tetratricopeptide (TPR) repeat protein
MTGRLIAAVLLLLGTACAQFARGSSDVVGRLRVRVAFEDHAPCNSSTRVVLTGAMGFALAEGSVNGECTAEFLDVPSGRYRVTVLGADATNADDGDVEVNSVINQDLEVRARHTEESDPSHWAAHASFVSVTELGVPSHAAKEFEKASRLMAKQDWSKAAERLHKGLALYPRYAAGYSNLGAVYSYLGKNAQAREALQQAIALDDRLAPAYVNLGRLSFLEKDYSNAESLLTRAMSLAPAENAGELFLLAYAQLTDHHLDQALQTSQQGHAAKLNHHAYLHLVAANAYEQQGKVADSMSELEHCLNEEPNGPRADQVRKALATLQAQTATR